MKRFSFAVTAVLLALLAAPVLAFPPQCADTCTCSSKCTQICAIGGTVSNCRTYGDCVGQCFAARSNQSTESLDGKPFASFFISTAPTTSAQAPVSLDCGSVR